MIDRSDITNQASTNTIIVPENISSPETMNNPLTGERDEKGEEESDDEIYEHFRIVADKGQTLLRVDKFLVDRIPGVSRNRIQQAAEAECILVNDKVVKSNYRVKPFDVVRIVMDRPKYDHEIVAEDIPLDVVYEDDDLMIVNKPAGLVVHPGHGNYSGTLVNALAWYFRNNPDYDVNDPRLGLVHRIDKDTSGLLVIAKTPHAKTHLGKQFFDKTTRREYVALTWGVPKVTEGTVIGNIGRDIRDRLKMAVYDPESGIGKHAVTHYKILEDLGYVSVIECKLETGRTHQIRAHMSNMGHPLFNDARYGGDKIMRGIDTSKYRQFVANCFKECQRQALHAKTIGFTHPTTGKAMYFSSPLPTDLTSVIEKWRQCPY